MPYVLSTKSKIIFHLQNYFNLEYVLSSLVLKSFKLMHFMLARCFWCIYTKPFHMNAAVLFEEIMQVTRKDKRWERKTKVFSFLSLLYLSYNKKSTTQNRNSLWNISAKLFDMVQFIFKFSLLIITHIRFLINLEKIFYFYPQNYFECIKCIVMGS